MVVFQASHEGVEEDGKLCLARVGLFDECEEDLTIFPSIRTNLAWDDGRVKFVNILSIRANRNRTDGFPRRCREKFDYTSVYFARLDKVTHCNNLMLSRNTGYILK